MAEASDETKQEQEIDLRDPLWAAFLALLWPGLGHIYQRRYAKGALFMVCILGIFFLGWNLGGKKVVYTSWREGDRRWHYLCQVWVGLPAWPAILQAFDLRPFGKELMRPPSLTRPITPEQDLTNDQPTELDQWQLLYHGDYELGTVFTMIAGLLNLLVIFDAAGGPVSSTRNEKQNQHDPDKVLSSHKSQSKNRSLESNTMRVQSIFGLGQHSVQ